jgi:hypothetical protein
MKKLIEIIQEKSKNESCIKESEVLFYLPPELHNEWDNFMRGKTCPILENGDHGVYIWDVTAFLNNFQ